MSIDFGNWAFRNNKLVYFLIAVLVIGGAYSAYEMSKLEDPELKVKLAMVAATPTPTSSVPRNCIRSSSSTMTFFKSSCRQSVRPRPPE